MTVCVRTHVPVHLPLCVFDFSASSLLFVVSVYVFLLYEVCVYVCACVHACVGMCVCSRVQVSSPLYSPGISYCK